MEEESGANAGACKNVGFQTRRGDESDVREHACAIRRIPAARKRYSRPRSKATYRGRTGADENERGDHALHGHRRTARESREGLEASKTARQFGRSIA